MLSHFLWEIGHWRLFLIEDSLAGSTRWSTRWKQGECKPTYTDTRSATNSKGIQHFSEVQPPYYHWCFCIHITWNLNLIAATVYYHWCFCIHISWTLNLITNTVHNKLKPSYLWLVIINVTGAIHAGYHALLLGVVKLQRVHIDASFHGSGINLQWVLYSILIDEALIPASPCLRSCLVLSLLLVWWVWIGGIYGVVLLVCSRCCCGRGCLCCCLGGFIAFCWGGVTTAMALVTSGTVGRKERSITLIRPTLYRYIIALYSLHLFHVKKIPSVDQKTTCQCFLE